MALSMLVGIVTCLLIAEPVSQRDELIDQAEQDAATRISFVNAVVQPFAEFFRRQGKFALIILLFIAVFRLSDIAMGIMANPFYLDMGYSKTDIADIAKVFGFFMSIGGAAIAGLLVVKWSIFRCLMIGAVAVASTNVLFALLSLASPELSYLALVISADNISGGFAATAFVAYLSSLTNRAYTATQYALFSSLMTLPGKFMSGFSGLVVDNFGYFEFFLVAAVLGIPAIILVGVLSRHARSLPDKVG
jgi:PAT family beta-lactamase induction signal transducer AmpG